MGIKCLWRVRGSRTNLEGLGWVWRASNGCDRVAMGVGGRALNQSGRPRVGLNGQEIVWGPRVGMEGLV